MRGGWRRGVQVAFTSSISLAALASPRTAGATYSVVAARADGSVVGAAGASCVPYEVIRILGDVPGRGAFVAQANFDDDAFAHALARLAAGASADVVLAEVTDEARFPNAPNMQYAAVDAHGGMAAVTGPGALRVAGDEQRAVDGFVVSAQGNILTSRLVVDRALAGFESSRSCDLAGRLVDALEAAGSDGEGDSRCTSMGRPANSAFVEVSDEAGVVVSISVPDVSPADPVAELRRRLEVYRATHPCAITVPAPEGPSTAEHPEREAATGCAIPQTRAPTLDLTSMGALCAWLVRRRGRRARGFGLSGGPRAPRSRFRHRAGSDSGRRPFG